MFDGFFHMVVFMHNEIECRMPSKIVCFFFWSSNITIIISQNVTAHLVSQCTDRFIFFHSNFAIRHKWCFGPFFVSFPLLFIYFIRENIKQKLGSFVTWSTFNAFDGDLINLSMWTMRTTQFQRYASYHVHTLLYFALMHEIKMTLAHELFNFYRIQYEK